MKQQGWRLWSSQRHHLCQSLKVRKGVVQVGSGSFVCLEPRMEERMEREEAGEVSKGHVEKGLIIELKFPWF